MPTVRAIMISILAMFLFKVACGQPGNPQTTQYSVVKKYDHPLFSSSDSLTISPNPNVSEEEDYGYPPGRYPINAECKVNSKTTLHLSRASMRGDTLVIWVEEKSPSYFHSLKIEVFGDDFRTLFKYHFPESEFPQRVLTTDQLLVLNRSKFSPGDEIRGFINFRGSERAIPGQYGDWNSKDDYVPSDVVIRGPFRAVIE